MTLEEFRLELDVITLTSSEWWPKIEELRVQFPHTISQRDNEPRVLDTDYDYRCFAYALNLHHSLKHWIFASLFELPADSCFFEFLMRRRAVRRSDTQIPRVTDLVVYRVQGFPAHIGVVVSDQRVVSKWGSGPSLEHGLFEVPSMFGNQIEVFEAPPFPVVERLFVEYSDFIRGDDPGSFEFTFGGVTTVKEVWAALGEPC